MIGTDAESSTVESHAERILIVEDPRSSTPITDTYAAVLRKEGYDVDVVGGATECMQRFSEPPALVLLGSLNYGSRWTDLCRKIRAVSDVPILMSTRFDSEIDAVVAYELGITGSLIDPSYTRELTARVRAALSSSAGPEKRARPPENSQSERGQLLAAGPVEIDLWARSVRVAGQPVYLARQEFALLVALMTPPRVVKTRDELIQTVWGEHKREGSRTIDTHMRRLRLKLEPDPAGPMILVTVRGVGFRFDDREGPRP